MSSVLYLKTYVTEMDKTLIFLVYMSYEKSLSLKEKQSHIVYLVAGPFLHSHLPVNLVFSSQVNMLKM